MSTTAPNTQLGKYQLVRQIGAGEMTELWLGLEGERKFAIKRIRQEFGEDKKYVQAFSEQARRASILHHENIVRIHDVGTPSGECFYAMDWVDGIDLRAALADAHATEQQIRIEHVMAIMLAVCDAFQYAHKKGIFHLDVSPANIIVGLDGVVKVIDFGIATAVNRAKTRPGAQEGKVGYMSPELCLGKSADARSDIFSLGVVLYELVTVRRLFKSATDFLTMSTIIEGQIPRPTTVRPGVAPELEEIVMKALESPREARYQTAGEMKAALERFCVATKLHASRDGLADYARFLAKKKERAESEPKKDEGEQIPGVISGAVENSTKLRQKTAGGNDSTLITRALTVNPSPRSKNVAVVAIGAIAALAVIGITIYVMQPSGEAATPAKVETPPPVPVQATAPAVAQPAPTPDAAEEIVDDVVEVEEVKPAPPEPPPPDPEPVAKTPPTDRGALVKLREPEPKPEVTPPPPPPVTKKKPIPKKVPKKPKWDPNGLFPENK